MADSSIKALLKGKKIHLVGIKGTGMAALAEILVSLGAVVTGSDVEEVFYTDKLLQQLGVDVRTGFTGSNIKGQIDTVVYSVAYSREENPELIEAAVRGIPLMSYPEMLGYLSGLFDSTGIAGTHGKTTTTAITGTILKNLRLPVTVIAGSEVPTFGNRCTVTNGQRYLVAETCEYRRHFLFFKADRIVIASIDADHLDYYRDLEDIYSAFEEYGRSLPYMGTVIYNADDPGAAIVAERIRKRRDDLRFIPFGENAAGPYRIVSKEIKPGKLEFVLEGFGSFGIHIPGIHTIYNTCGAVAVTGCLLEKEELELKGKILESVKESVENFKGSRRRSEVLGERGGVLFMDDYAHHPTEIRATLKGIKEFYPGRRIIADFMPHTYSRTEMLMDEFAGSFEAADIVVLHDIYASAREKKTSELSGKDLYKRVAKSHPSVFYFERFEASLNFLISILTEGDLFITMGAGDNWKLGRKLFDCMN